MGSSEPGTCPGTSSLPLAHASACSLRVGLFSQTPQHPPPRRRPRLVSPTPDRARARLLLPPLFQGATAVSTPRVCENFNAARASRVQPQARAGGKRRREEKIRFWHTLLRKTKARAGGERKRSHQGPHRRAPGETETPGDRPRGFGDARGRIAVYLIGIARAARGRLFWAPFGGLAQNTSK